MIEIVIDKKNYVLLLKKEYEILQKKAALKTKAEKIFTIEKARTRSQKIIRKLAGEK